MSLTRNDLWRIPAGTGLRNLKRSELSPVSLADLVEVVQSEGGETMQWCTDHLIAWADGSDCWGAGINGIDACRIGSALVWREEDE